MTNRLSYENQEASVAMITRRCKSAHVLYTVGVGGPHSDPGLYRHNPVTRQQHFTTWRGLGQFPKDHTITEFVCATCGEALPDSARYYPAECECGTWRTAPRLVREAEDRSILSEEIESNSIDRQQD